MSVSNQNFVEGVDPTGQTALAALMLQLIRSATMYADKALIIVSEDTPDVVANTEFIRCLWVKRSEQSSIIRRYSSATATWIPVVNGTGTITTAMLAAASVTLSKLYAPGAGSASKILRVAAGGSFELVDLTLTDNSVTIAKLYKATGNGGKMLRVAGTGDGTGFEFFTLDAVSYIATGALPITKLAVGSDLQFMRMVGTTPTWVTTSPGFNPTYITAVNLIAAQTAAVNSFTTIDLAATMLAAGASTSSRIAILKIYGAIVEDTAVAGVFNTREDATKATVEMLKVVTVAAATNNTLTGHSIVFQKLTALQTFDYQIPTATYFAAGLSLDLVGYINP